MKSIFFLSVLSLSIFVSACSTAKATATTKITTDTPAAPAFTSTPDLCTSANLPVEVAKVHKLTREFDDYAALASNTLQSPQLLIQLIPDMQRVLRDAEDQSVPACLITLKKIQLVDMNTVVQTLMVVMNISAPKQADLDKVNAGITQARNLHGQYDIEMARLLGITMVAPPTTTPGAATTTPEVVATPSTAAVTVTNLGASAVNLRTAPNVNAPGAGVLGSQISTTALGKTADDQWIQVLVPDKPAQTAWVFAQLVQLSVPIASLPVVTP